MKYDVSDKRYVYTQGWQDLKYNCPLGVDVMEPACHHRGEGS
jgi:hypothetical protein